MPTKLLFQPGRDNRIAPFMLRVAYFVTQRVFESFAMAEFLLTDANGVVAVNPAAAVESQLGNFGVALDIARRQIAQELPDGIDVVVVFVLRPFVIQLEAEPDFK